MSKQYEHDYYHDDASNERLSRVDETSRYRFAGLALGIHATITVIVEHGNRNLHGGVYCDHQRDYAPGEVRPCCEQRKYCHSYNVKRDRDRMTEQVKAQEYVFDLALFGDLHAMYHLTGNLSIMALNHCARTSSPARIRVMQIPRNVPITQRPRMRVVLSMLVSVCMRFTNVRERVPFPLTNGKSARKDGCCRIDPSVAMVARSTATSLSSRDARRGE